MAAGEEGCGGGVVILPRGMEQGYFWANDLTDWSRVMRPLFVPKVIALVGTLCVLIANVVSRHEGNITTPIVSWFLTMCCSVGAIAGVGGAGWALVERNCTERSPSSGRVVAFCVALVLASAWTFVRLPDYVLISPR